MNIITAYKLLSLISRPAKLTTYTILSLFSLLSTYRTRSSSAVAYPSSTICIFLITDRSFRYASHSPYLWNQLPSSSRQPHSVHCPPGSPHLAHITSSQSPPLLSPSLRRSYRLSLHRPTKFQSILKTHYSSLSQTLSSIIILIPSGLPPRILNLY